MARQTLVNSVPSSAIYISDAADIRNLPVASYSIWVYFSPSFVFSGVTNAVLFTKETLGGTTRYGIKITKSGANLIFKGTFGNGEVQVTKTLAWWITMMRGKWNNFILVYDPTGVPTIGIQIYWNGELFTTNGTTGAAAIDDTRLLIGGGSAFQTGWLGKVAEFGMWNRTLTSEEIENLAINKYTPRLISDGLLIALRILGFEDPEPDSSGANHPGYAYYDIEDNEDHFMSPQDHVPGIKTFLPGTDVVGIYQSYVQGVWEFNQSLEDLISTNDFSATDEKPSNYQRYTKFDLIQGKLVGKYGLKFEENRTWSTDGTTISFVNTDNQYGLTVGFWWYSPGPVGRIRHSVSRYTTPRMAPIIAKANSYTVDGNETAYGEWVISEVGYSDTQNAIQLALCRGASTPSSIYISRPYTPGWHHVFVTYQGKGYASVIKIEIDGKENCYYMNEWYKNTLVSSAYEIKLNDIGYGPTAHKTNQDGAIIADLIIRSAVDSDTNDSVKMMRFGWEYIAVHDLYYDKSNFFGVGYRQESMVNTNYIFTEGDNLMLARSDGSILKGERPLWDVNYTFYSLDDIDLFEPQDPTKVSIVNNKLRVEATAIRIP